ncbi:MAG: DUF364 domain-containing protein [Candidatus Riflebacteria bacterium]|nr:DUF364 domain-containing protein [Candidatus Riflebacteria bacterium]
MSTTVATRLVAHLQPVTAGAQIADVRIGLGYSAVRLSTGEVGLSWTPKEEARCCQQFGEAGTLVGRPAGDLLGWLERPDALRRMLGLATANALGVRLAPAPATGADVIGLLGLEPADHLVMVGHFGPLLPPIRKTGCRLQIVEAEPDGEELGPEEGRQALGRCSVAIITATSLVTGGLEGYLEALGPVRAAVLLGPSVPLFPEVFRGSRLTHLAGSRVVDGARVLQIVSEGGGTPTLKVHLEAVIVPVG